ncbi:protoporphyrinogen oxidase HemJ [Campylobacter sp. MIT 21-1685]|uniref:protoporphyrinogen oxidase HemJ n=1 Tax=unclassified Campylobacter TaxID=2593542 RepID=UPI00224AF3E6|nr:MULTISPECIES: protoporphyrinogen oxidase HemJ [unclassified Campylobacter]MCX2683490.1 protoporphyrinogen oxidase HemJ [Campylobacter sp. MIT 21-1684]MCX2751771.1 protoporphyrinogen oxidase HemJ [Campylobacter sp. MIT 21-1682]MCX2807972.1 protoporphyrinogen oxidase HemJ [Campylobacter sp. MIT 21-1685]
MTELINEYYFWIKWIHYIAFVSWMAGLFYLPRLFVYHKENIENEGFVKVVKIQERRLYFKIQTPAMILTIISGSLMLHTHKEVLMIGSGFMHAKLTCALLLFFYHIHNYSCLKALANGTCRKSGRYFRVYNEIPTILFALIALMMVVRPF